MDSKVFIDKIIGLEWDMFQAVNEGGPRAGCQEDKVTFEGMRRGQFEAWSFKAVKSYFDDLTSALVCGRNLLTEKYIHMMKNTDPSQYDALVASLTPTSDAAIKMVNELSDKFVEQTEDLFLMFPYVSSSGRPLRSIDDLQGVTSIETYQKGELMTYSEKTLSALKDHLIELDNRGLSLARLILENSVKHYGYQSLEQAENAIKQRINQSDNKDCDCDND